MSFRNLNKLRDMILGKIPYEYSAKELDDIAKRVVLAIQTKTRLGVSPVTDKKLKPLTENTIERRKLLSRYNKTHEMFSPERSNLTLTGALVDAIRYEFRTREQKIMFSLPGTHPGYSTGKGKRTATVPFSIILRGQREMGRDFLGLSDKMRKTLLLEIRRLILRKIRELR